MIQDSAYTPDAVGVTPSPNTTKFQLQQRLPGGGLNKNTDGDARRNQFQKRPLKVTILSVAPANFIT